MIHGLRVLQLADDDVDETALHIAGDSVDQAMRFYDAVNVTYKMILEAPMRWPSYGLSHPKLADIRKRSIPGFPNHLVFYADMVEIVRVIHGSRDIPAILESMLADE